MNYPLVSIICLCYNQVRFVTESLDSVTNQTYTNIQIIVVDDGSSDKSKEVIQEWLEKNKEIPFININENVGNTTAFNKGLSLARGKYVIDLACDDVLENNRIERQVLFFESKKNDVGVIYSNALYISEDGERLKIHFSQKRFTPFQGDIYEQLVNTYFIPPPTMMLRRAVLDELEGYDESLEYEDFDFWIRSSRKWKYAYQDEVLTQIREVSSSHSRTLYKVGDKKLASTLKICQKIRKLNQNKSEENALINRLEYEIRHAFVTGCKEELGGFFVLYDQIRSIPIFYVAIRCIGKLGINFFG